MSAYVDEVLDLFIADFDGTEIDTSGAYGAQSPDLVQVYVSRLLGRDWRFPYGWAAQLWLDHRGVMAAAGFERIERDAPLQRGDVLVFDGVNTFGTVGIFTAPAAGRLLGVHMFAQNPGPARIARIELDGANQLLGAWRFTAGAECVALAGTYADKLQTRRDHRVIEQMKADEFVAGWKVEGASPEARALIADTLKGTVMASVEREAAEAAARRMLHGYDPTCPPGNLKPYIEWSATTPADPTAEHWMKPLAVGDVVGNTRAVRVERTDEELPSGRHYRHYARGHGKTALLAKLKALFGGKP